jgi:phosphoribosylformylglycinamidine synthase
MRAGLVQACHDLSEGGLALALAEMALGSRLGIDAELIHDELSALSLLFSESNGRLVIEVTEQDAAQLEALLASVPLTRVGVVTEEPRLRIAINGTPQIDLPVDSLVSAWLRQSAGVTK